MYKSRHEDTGEGFFLASRNLLWPMIGLSLIAANISTEQIVGQAGQGAGNVGMAVASYEWMAITGNEAQPAGNQPFSRYQGSQ